MANTQALCTSFKVDLLNAVHAFNGTGVPAHTVSTADSFKAALYLASATVNATTTAYSATNEVSGTGYTAGGVAVTFGTAPSSTSTTAFITPSASIVFSGVTLATAFDAVLLYNSSQSNKAVSVHTFGSQTVTAGTFTLTMPTNDSSTGLIRLA
jgi:intracellular septation protein A